MGLFEAAESTPNSVDFPPEPFDGWDDTSLKNPEKTKEDSSTVRVNFLGKVISRNCVELATLERILLMKNPDLEILRLYDAGVLNQDVTAEKIQSINQGLDDGDAEQATVPVNKKAGKKNTRDKMMESVLALVCQSSEFSRVASKQNERKTLNDLNQLTEYPLKKSAADGERKVRVLL